MTQNRVVQHTYIAFADYATNRINNFFLTAFRNHSDHTPPIAVSEETVNGHQRQRAYELNQVSRPASRSRRSITNSSSWLARPHTLETHFSS